MHLFTLILLPSIAISLSLHFNDAGDFYHELGEEAMKFLFQIIPLSAKTVEMLAQLLADDMIDIQEPYNKVCNLMSYSWATNLLTLVHNRKDLEMHLLGPACLSPAIITARKSIPYMWPPTGFPLLVHDLWCKEIATDLIKDILGQSLKQPEWWQTAGWINAVKWDEMDDFRIWRMVPPGLCSKTCRPYMIKALLQNDKQPTFQDLEELLMKSIRISDFDDSWREALKEKNLDNYTLLGKFAHLRDQWSTKVLGFLEWMYTKESEREFFLLVLLDSALVQFASWQGTVFDMATITNDIFELFTVALSVIGSKKEGIREAFRSFLDEIPDWSIVRPQVLDRAIEIINGAIDITALLRKYVDRMSSHISTLNFLPEWLLEYSTTLQAHKCKLKRINSQRIGFEGTNEYPLNPYIQLLYQEWARDKVNWPGMIAAHEKIKQHVRKVLKHNKDGTWDPKTDQEYDQDAWELAFSSIAFEITHNIPNRVVPSSCFLQALLYYHKHILLNWSRLSKAIGKKCVIPKKEEERNCYENALNVATSYLIFLPLLLPKVNAELLQDLIRGDGNESAKGTMNKLAGRIVDLTV